MELFNQVLDPQTTPKFFLHWMWRMTAQLGVTESWLRSKEIEKAKVEADAFLHSALETADPHLQALSWEMQTRVAIAKEDWGRAANCVHKGLDIVGRVDVAVAGWQVHARAWRLHQRRQRYTEAESHRESAQADILKIADSFPEGEPLRDTFLSAAPIARILNPLAGRAADG